LFAESGRIAALQRIAAQADSVEKSSDAVDLILFALLARFQKKDAKGLIVRGGRDVDRSKWNCGASNSRL